MDWLQFTASVIGSLAWPAAVVIVGFMFKDRLEKLLEKVRHAKGAGFEFDFAQDIKRVIEEAAQVEAAQLPQPGPGLPAEGQGEQQLEMILPPLDEQRRLAELLRERPSALILDAWRDLEKAVQDVITEIGVEIGSAAKRNAPPTLWAGLLQRNGVLTHEEAGLITDLRSLRNKVAHTLDWEPTVSDALDYHRTATLLTNVLRKKLKELVELKQQGEI